MTPVPEGAPALRPPPALRLPPPGRSLPDAGALGDVVQGGGSEGSSALPDPPAPDAEDAEDAHEAADTLDALPDAVLVLGADRRILVANAAAVRLLGYGREELVGAPCVTLLDARHRDGSAVWAGGWDAGSRLTSVRRLTRQVVTVRPRHRPQITVAVTGTYRRDARGAVAGMVLCLRQTPPRAPASPTGIEIVAAVSHELRSPLTSVKGYTSLLLNRWDDLSDDDKLMMLAQVNHDADRVARLIGELLDISRLETGRLVLRRQLVDLPALTDSVLGKVRLQYPGLDAVVVWPDGWPPVPADPDKIEQVLTNLLENACKYASAKGLAVAGTVGSSAVSVTVTDRGDGIPAEDLPRAFDKFFRRAQGRPDGSGLGLWISRGLVESHGGRLTATSAPGEGSAFCFTLPLANPKDQRTP